MDENGELARRVIFAAGVMAGATIAIGMMIAEPYRCEPITFRIQP